jgi:RNA polymerase sigma-70 factor (ECF subfamily)
MIIDSFSLQVRFSSIGAAVARPSSHYAPMPRWFPRRPLFCAAATPAAMRPETANNSRNPIPRTAYSTRLAVTRIEPITRSAPVWEIALSDDDNPQDTRQVANAAMERYAAGDDAAFGELYDALAPRLHRFLSRQCRDSTRADDLLQQTLLHIHRARGRFVPGADVFPWAFAIARRLFIDGVRRAKHEVVADTTSGESFHESTAPQASADDLLHTKRVAQAVERELAKIPETHRVAFELVKTEGLSMREAAAVLGTTVTAVKLRAHRAYLALRAALSEAN